MRGCLCRGGKLGLRPKPRIRNFFEKKFLMDLQKTCDRGIFIAVYREILDNPPKICYNKIEGCAPFDRMRSTFGRNRATRRLS